MKGILRNPSPFSGLNDAIRENEYLLFYKDIVNHRNMGAKEFFEYINNKYGDNYKIRKKIEYMSYNISSYKANKLEIIMNYKKAELSNRFENIKALETEFKKIKNVETEQSNVKKSKNLVRKFSYESNLFDTDQIKKELNKLLDDYLNDDVNLSDRELETLNARLLKHISIIDYKKYIDFVIKRKKVEIVNLSDVNQIIEVLKYFIKNLNNKLYKIEFCDYIIKLKKKEIDNYNKEINRLAKKEYRDEKEIKLQINTLILLSDAANEVLNSYINIACGIYIDGEEKLDSSITESISKLIIWKRQKIQKYIKNYNRILDYLINLKNIICNGDKKFLNGLRISSIEIEDDFIIEMLKSITKTLNGYKNICSISLSDSKLDDIKADYLKKVYKNNI